VSTTDTRSVLIALLFSLPWRQRAAIALVDHLGLSYVEAAAVLGVDVSEFRGLLHRGRDALLRKYRTHAARRTPTTTDRRRVPE
jgi:DNA-directed RNA polymerase specialized sigma24 family protein